MPVSIVAGAPRLPPTSPDIAAPRDGFDAFDTAVRPMRPRDGLRTR